MSQNELSLDKTQEEAEMDQEVAIIRKDLEIDKNRLMYHVNRGMQGLNIGMTTGLPRMDAYLDGTQRSSYYLMGADSSVGKTTLGDFMYVYNLYRACKAAGIKLDLDYYSYEISLPMKKAKWASLLYHFKYKEDIGLSLILGRKAGYKLSNEQYSRVQLVSIEIEEIFDSFNFYDTPSRPTEVWRNWIDKAAKYGDIIRNSKNAGRANEIVGYKAKDSAGVFKMTIMDHIALGEPEKGYDTKRTMDLQSSFAVRARNLFDESVLFIQQFNNNLQSASRDRKGLLAYLPSRMDFGDSTYTFRDADVVLGLTKPANFQLSSFGDYTDLDQWGNYFVLTSIMKNRYGVQGNHVPMFLNSIVGVPEELPTELSWNAMIQDRYIGRAKLLDKLWQ